MKDVDGADEWYAGWQAKLRASRLARFFHNCRTDIQHVGKNYLNGGISGADGPRLLLSDGGFGNDDKIPETDAFVAADHYFSMVCDIVRDAYQRFGAIIDPDIFYSVEGLEANGLAIEDIEEELGFPRGFSELTDPSELTLEDRLACLRRHASISNCRHLLDRVPSSPESAWA